MSIVTMMRHENCAYIQKCVVTIDITAYAYYNIDVTKRVTTNIREEYKMSNYSKVSVGKEARTELHDKLSLTGAEISVNELPAGACVPFVHAHKKNEEIYAVLSGKGRAVIDGETVELAAGDWLRIAPSAKRQFFAAEDVGISYICIQVREGSLEEYTAADAEICQ